MLAGSGIIQTAQILIEMPKYVDFKVKSLRMINQVWNGDTTLEELTVKELNQFSASFCILYRFRTKSFSLM